MTKDFYLKIQEPFRSYRNVIVWVDRIVTLLMACAYVGLVVSLYLNEDMKTFYFLTVIPLFFFLGLTALRTFVNAKRPYEVFSFEPIIPKKKGGKSFPSRHVGSAVMISMCFLKVNFLLGAVGLVFSALIALLRVIGGVHFVRDVAVAYVGGIVFGIALFLL